LRRRQVALQRRIARGQLRQFRRVLHAGGAHACLVRVDLAQKLPALLAQQIIDRGSTRAAPFISAPELPMQRGELERKLLALLLRARERFAVVQRGGGELHLDPRRRCPSVAQLRLV
jgi:hypothetical protein